MNTHAHKNKVSVFFQPFQKGAPALGRDIFKLALRGV